MEGRVRDGKKSWRWKENQRWKEESEIEGRKSLRWREESGSIRAAIEQYASTYTVVENVYMQCLRIFTTSICTEHPFA